MFKLKKAPNQFLFCGLCCTAQEYVVEFFYGDNETSYPDTQQYFCQDCIEKMVNTWNEGEE